MFPQAGRRFLSFCTFSDNTNGNVSQRKNKEVIFNLIKQSYNSKGLFCSPYTHQYIPQTYFVDLKTIISPIIIVLNARRSNKDCTSHKMSQSSFIKSKRNSN